MTTELKSWRDGEAKRAIIRFIDVACAAGSPGFIAPVDRVAVFDNDGTLWCERPLFVQASFVIDQLNAMKTERPELADDAVLVALAASDIGGAVRAGGVDGIMQAIAALHAGITAEAFAEEAAAWLGSAVHPDFGVPFRRLVYQPMLEVIDLLREHEFRVFVVSGGGVEFVRAVSEELYGVSPDDVVGSAVEVELERIDGVVQLVRQPRFRGSPNEGAPKTVNIQAHIGKRPVFAAGNTAGDREMLEYAQSPNRASLSIVIDHDDYEREYAYAGASFTDPGAEPIVETAARLGWPVVSMRDDWINIFPEGVHK
jgi:phosphoserine phosphatase